MISQRGRCSMGRDLHPTPSTAPTGKSLRFIGSDFCSSQPRPAKIFCFRFSESCGHLPASRRRQRGRIAIVTDVGSGERWTQWRARRARPLRTVKPCGPDPPTLGSSLRVTSAQVTVANTPGHRGEHGAAVKTTRAGNAGVSAVPVVACVRKCAFSLHARLAGAASIRHSLRPLMFGGTSICKARTRRAARTQMLGEIRRVG